MRDRLVITAVELDIWRGNAAAEATIAATRAIRVAKPAILPLSVRTKRSMQDATIRETEQHAARKWEPTGPGRKREASYGHSAGRQSRPG